MKVVGITGRKRHGKDTIAQQLEAKGFKLLRFADPLKNMLRAFYSTHGMSPVEIERRIEGDLKEAPCTLLCGKTPRHAMQTLGTEWGRDMIGRDLWVDSLKHRALQHERAVVPDVRFANECGAIKAIGGAVWRVDASGRRSHVEQDQHASEVEIATLPVEIEIPNNGSMFELHCAVDAALDATP